MTSGLLATGRFGKQDFVYVAADDVYLCPATHHYTNESKRLADPLVRSTTEAWLASGEDRGVIARRM
jgi:hypothetical protein